MFNCLGFDVGQKIYDRFHHRNKHEPQIPDHALIISKNQPRVSDPVNGIISEIVLVIFELLQEDLPTVALVCRQWKKICDSNLLRNNIYPHDRVFGEEDYPDLLGIDSDKAPPLPRRAYGDLKKSKDGFVAFVTRNAKTRNENDGFSIEYPLYLDVLENLTKNTKLGHAIGFHQDSWKIAVQERKQIDKPHWVFIDPESVIGQGQRHWKQEWLVAQLEKASISNLRDIIFMIFLRYVKFGKRSFQAEVGKKDPFIRVKDKVEGWAVVVGLSDKGIQVYYPHEKVHAFDVTGVVVSKIGY